MPSFPGTSSPTSCLPLASLFDPEIEDFSGPSKLREMFLPVDTKRR
jgi:hypothetical protein